MAKTEGQTVSYYDMASPGAVSDSRRKKRGWIIGIVVGVILLIVLIVGLVVGLRARAEANAYPDYKRLSYALSKEYAGSNFFNEMNYWSDADPAQGGAWYFNQTWSKSANLTVASETSAILRVDMKSKNQNQGRPSARVYTKETYNNGLFLFDVVHSPYGCGTWPALWLTDQYNWPNHGEIVSIHLDALSLDETYERI